MIFEETLFFIVLVPVAIGSMLDVMKGLERAISPVNLTVWFAVVVVAIPAARLQEVLSLYHLDDGMGTLFLFLFIVLLGILLARFIRGFRNKAQGKHRTPIGPRRNRSMQRSTIDTAPFRISLAIGLGGYGAAIMISGGPIAYYSVAHLGGLDKSISAYIYALQYLIVPSVLALAVANHLSGRRQSIIVLLVLLFLLFDAFVLGRRGTYIRLGIGMIVFFLSVRHTLSLQSRIMSRSMMLLALASLVTIIYVTPVIRHQTALGHSFNLEQFFDDLSQRDVFAGSTDDSGNELVYAASLIEATDMFGVDFGLKWAYPFISLIPRQIWHDKPYYTEFSGNNIDLIAASSGFEIARGAAPTFVADTYARFGLFGAVIFLTALFPLDRKIRSALTGWTNLGQLVFAYLVIVSFVYFLLQDFSQGMLHFIYAILPIKFLTWVRELTRRSIRIPG